VQWWFAIHAMNDASEQKKRLQQTIDILCEDAARVELWACALVGFAQPVPDPDYAAMAKYRINEAPKARPNRPQ
jgi:hypothetical protein